MITHKIFTVIFFIHLGYVFTNTYLRYSWQLIQSPLNCYLNKLPKSGQLYGIAVFFPLSNFILLEKCVHPQHDSQLKWH